MVKRDLIEDFFSRKISFTGIFRELVVPRVEKIVSIVGPRRSGKTWYFYSLLDSLELPMYVNFEDLAFRNLSVEEFFNVIKIFSELKYPPKNLMLDEVQVLKDWEVLVRSLHDRGYKIYVTGSSSKLLPREIATQLRGRSLTFILLPFSFREFLKAKKIEIDTHTFEGRGRILSLLKEYLIYGSYPEVVMSENKERLLKEYFDEIFYKDFVERHKIRSIEFGRFLFEFSFQNFSKEMSIRKIKKFFGKNISERTLYSYVEKLQDTLVVFFLKRFSRSVYLRETWPRKLYVCDNGVSTILGFSKELGARMENCVFLDILRKRNDTPLLEVYYWRDHQQREVDFVLKEGLKVNQLIQVTYASGKDEVERREIKALMKASKELKCKNLLVVTWDYEDMEKVQNREIVFKPLWKWLMF